MSAIHPVPFITRGLVYRNDIETTGSLARGAETDPGFPMTNPTFRTDGDILICEGTSTGTTSGFDINLNLSGSPIRASLFGVRAKSGSKTAFNGFIIDFFSGSTLIASPIINTGSFRFYSGSLSPNYVDKIVINLDANAVGLVNSYLDFIQLYNENVELRYINNPSSYSLKKRVIELSPPMREQGILQHLGAESPRINIDGVIISDSAFTAQQYRDKLVDVWQEGNWQFLYTDMINYKFIPESVEITQLPSVPNYYQFRMELRQYTTISANSGSYNLS